MSFTFLLEDGRLVGDSEGRNHSVLIGWTKEDGYDLRQLELRPLAEPNKALRICFQPFWEKRDGTRGDFWAVYVQIDKILPNEKQWATLSDLYRLNGWRNSIVTWDIFLPETEEWNRNREGTLAELREILNRLRKFHLMLMAGWNIRMARRTLCQSVIR